MLTYMLRHVLNRKGFILLDAVIGLVILSIAILAMLTTYKQSSAVTAAASNYTKATYIAHQTLEDFKKFDGSTRAEANWTVTSPINRDNIVFDVTVTDPVILNRPQLNSLVVPKQVSVTWTESTGPKTVTMSAYYYFRN